MTKAYRGEKKTAGACAHTLTQTGPAALTSLSWCHVIG